MLLQLVLILSNVGLICYMYSVPICKAIVVRDCVRRAGNRVRPLVIVSANTQVMVLYSAKVTSCSPR